MLLSEFLRKTDLSLPIQVVIKSSNLNVLNYAEVIILSKAITESKSTIYKIQFITKYGDYKTNDVCWMDETWCSTHILEKIVQNS